MSRVPRRSARRRLALAAGALVALVLTTLGESRRTLPAAYAVCVALGVAAVVGGVVLAQAAAVT